MFMLREFGTSGYLFLTENLQGQFYVYFMKFIYSLKTETYQVYVSPFL